MRVFLRPVAALTVALTAVLVSGCGASPVEESPGEAQRAVRAAYLATVNARSATMKLHAELAAQVGGRTERAELTGRGRFDFADKTSRTTITTPLGITVEIRTVGVAFYEKAPLQLRKRFPGDRPWMRVNFASADRAQYGGPLYVFRPNGPDDPWQMLGFLRAASSTRFVDTATVDGTDTRHYQTTIRLADLAALGGKQTGPARRRFQEKIGLDAIPVEVWLDDQGRLRRMQVTVPLRLPGAEWTGTTGEVTGEGTATMEFSDFGTAVSVQAPPRRQVDDLTDLVAARGLEAVAEIVGII